MLLAFNIDPTIESPMGGRVINLHRASERQNYVIIASALFLGGLILFGFGALANSKGSEREGPINEPQDTPLPKIVDDYSSLEKYSGTRLDLAMRNAVVDGHKQAVAMLLDRGADPNGNLDGVNWLHMACLNGHKDIVQLLIEHGANVNSRDYFGYTPLDRAEHNEHREIIALLKQHAVK